MGTVLRAMVNDLTAATYDDDTLETTLVVAAFQVKAEGLRFAQDFRADIGNVEIVPDPTLDATRDDSFANLVTLKAAGIIDQGAALTAASQAIFVKDGKSSIDLRGVFGAKFKLLEKGWGTAYEDAKFEYQAGAVRVAGQVIMTPFRLFADGGWGAPGDDRWTRPVIY